jgi:hypothetical protein
MRDPGGREENRGEVAGRRLDSVEGSLEIARRRLDAGLDGFISEGGGGAEEGSAFADEASVEAGMVAGSMDELRYLSLSAE